MRNFDIRRRCARLALLFATMCPAAGFAAEIIVDNSDPGFSILSGGDSGETGWQLTSATSGRWGPDYRFKRTDTAFGEVEWRPNLPEAGLYEVAVWYTQGSNRSTDAPYTIDYSGGSQTVTVNQRTNGAQWVVLGTFPFAAGTSGRVRLSNAASLTVVIADAVRFTSQTPAPIQLTMAVSPNGTGTTSPAGVSARTANEVVNITATPAAGYSFSHWTVSAGQSVANPTAAATTVTMDVSKTVTAVFTQNAPAGEFRGMWVTRFEWPSTNLATVQNNINTILQKLKDNNFNAVIMQMRGQADTLYPSPYEPWSPILSSSGNTPAGWGSFDPLQYAIDAAHSRGLEFHAYMNTHVCWQSGAENPPNNPNHLFYQHCNAADPNARDWLIHDQNGNPVQYEESGYVWMAPGVPEFQAYTRKQIMYVVENYDIDGVHYDRVRSPDVGFSYDPISQARKAGEGNPHNLGHAAWMRDQITRMLCDLYAQIMEVKPHIKVSSSPLGLYRGSSYSQYGYPTSACGYQYGYSCVYQDAQAWLAAGAQDFIVPQIYWADPPYRTANPNFSEVLPDWVANNAGRHVYPGSTTGSHTAAALVHEINAARNLGAQGNVVFSYSSFNSNNYWASYSGSGGPYAQPAPLPPMPWKTNPTTGIIIGNVTGVDGVTPVVDAHITRNGSDYIALSSGDGLYSFLLVPPGTYTINCNKLGLGLRQVNNVVVTAGQVTRVNITYAPPPTRTITAWHSVATHGVAGEASIALDPLADADSSTIEPRSGGVTRIEVTFDGTITLADPSAVSLTGYTTIDGIPGPAAAYLPSSVSVTGGNTLALTFAPGLLPDETCYHLTVGAGAIAETLAGDSDCRFRILLGDTTGNGIVNLGDALLTKLRIGAALPSAVRYDLDRDGTIDLADALFGKSRVASPARKVVCP